uniref:Cold-regulated protein BLT14 n=1 Tax=Hordeum vulgare TaxID=4513 RepID=CR14_HORVU|nr:RecName: Full=Cold-regulated protein BLT14 [Hordeum vulgare]CAA40779.1 BLT14 protein [Hordeum vulgare subsp. vulgare]prf//1710255A cold induced gene BLT14 [Hordeum vulgare]
MAKSLAVALRATGGARVMRRAGREREGCSDTRCRCQRWRRRLQGFGLAAAGGNRYRNKHHYRPAGGDPWDPCYRPMIISTSCAGATRS